MATVLHDIKYGARVLISRPGFTLAAILTLALGIGANTAIFSVINAFFLKPLPYPHGERLVDVHNTYPSMGLDDAGTSIPDYLDRRERAEALEDLAIYTFSSFNFAAGGTPERYIGVIASPSLFSVLSTGAILGRTFTAEEAVPGNDKVVVLSHALWRNRFAGSAEVVGTTVRLNGEPYQVVGVMPQGFAFPNRRVDLWVPFAFTEDQKSDNERGREFSTSIGRLKPGATVEQLNAQMDAIVQANAERIATLDGGQGFADFLRSSNFTGRADSYHEFLVGELRPTMLVLQGVVAFVFLIACANVANLMLTRVLARQKELAVRTAVGAERWCVTRQLILEGVLLGMLGGIAGLGISILGIELISHFGLDRSTQNFEVRLDVAVFAFAFVVSVLAGVLLSLLPVAQFWRLDVNNVIKEGGRGATAGRRATLVRGVLVAMQMALAVTLLIGAGLLGKSFLKMQDETTGFDPDGVVTVRLELPENRYPDDAAQRVFQDRLLERIRALPGVRMAGMTSVLPFSGNNSQGSYRIDGYTPPPGQPNPHGMIRFVDEDFFEVMNIPLLRGRGFDRSLDQPGGQPVVVIDEFLVNRYFKNTDPIGQRIANGQDADGNPLWATVVGVVGNVKHIRLTEEIQKETYYFYYRQRAPGSVNLVLHTGIDPAAISSQVRDAVLAVDPEQPVYDIRTMDQRISASLDTQRAPTVLLAIFAAVAIALAVIGIYGVLSYSVGSRTTELGVRMALGADRGRILRLVLEQGGRLIAVGLGVGTVAAFLLARLLQSMLFGVAPSDPLIYSAVVLVLAAVGILACWLPARRATRVAPMEALHYE